MEPDATWILETRGLTKRFGSFTAVSGLTLGVEPGEIFAFLGPNGAGKTTTIRMIMGILRPTSGSATVNGLECAARREEVMRHLGCLPDDPVFYDYLKGREILRFVAEMHGLDRRGAMARSGALAERLELQGALEDYAANYSRGMKKKLGLACALLHEPELLLLDEPTSGLDPMAARVVQELIRAQSRQGRAVFFSTHLLEQAERLCRRVGILFEGRLVALGTPGELSRDFAPGGSLEEVFFAVASGKKKEEAEPGEGR